MDVPAAVLEELKCSRCSVYLSRGPVYLQHDGAAACGRCFAPERPANRNTQYEATARLLKFPCKYRELGCRVTVPYVEEAEVIAHEEVCEHRQYVCPVLGSARCDWLGTRTEILQHCQAEHPDSVLDNPATLIHDISKASLTNYIITAFQMIFLLHTKVCVASGKIYHAIRLFEMPAEAANFFFILDIKRDIEQVTKKGQVAPQGCLAIQEPTSLTVNTNSLLNVLGGFDSTTFTVTVKRIEEKCVGCAGEVTVLQYRDKGGWRCERCVPARRACIYQGCQHTDIAIKCSKHLFYFCQQRTECYFCDVEVSRGSLSAHYGSAHKDNTHRAGSTWRATQGSINNYPGRWCLVSSVAGTAVCEYKLTDSKFHLDVYTPVSSEGLSEIRCEVRVTNTVTGHTKIFTPDAEYNYLYDWRIFVEKEEFPSWNTEMDVSVDIKRAESQ